MNYSKKRETISHFTCDICKGWWSIAESTDWKPFQLMAESTEWYRHGSKNLYCPHCGKKCDDIKDDDIKVKYEGDDYTGILNDE